MVPWGRPQAPVWQRGWRPREPPYFVHITTREGTWHLPPTDGSFWRNLKAWHPLGAIQRSSRRQVRNATGFAMGFAMACAMALAMGFATRTTLEQRVLHTTLERVHTYDSWYAHSLRRTGNEDIQRRHPRRPDRRNAQGRGGRSWVRRKVLLSEARRLRF